MHNTRGERRAGEELDEEAIRERMHGLGSALACLVSVVGRGRL